MIQADGSPAGGSRPDGSAEETSREQKIVRELFEHFAEPPPRKTISLQDAGTLLRGMLERILLPDEIKTAAERTAASPSGDPPRAPDILPLRSATSSELCSSADSAEEMIIGGAAGRGAGAAAGTSGAAGGAGAGAPLGLEQLAVDEQVSASLPVGTAITTTTCPEQPELPLRKEEEDKQPGVESSSAELDLAAGIESLDYDTFLRTLRHLYACEAGGTGSGDVCRGGIPGSAASTGADKFTSLFHANCETPGACAAAAGVVPANPGSCTEIESDLPHDSLPATRQTVGGVFFGARLPENKTTAQKMTTTVKDINRSTTSVVHQMNSVPTASTPSAVNHHPEKATEFLKHLLLNLYDEGIFPRDEFVRRAQVAITRKEMPQLHEWLTRAMEMCLALEERKQVASLQAADCLLDLRKFLELFLQFSELRELEKRRKDAEVEANVGEVKKELDAEIEVLLMKLREENQLQERVFADWAEERELLARDREFLTRKIRNLEEEMDSGRRDLGAFLNEMLGRDLELQKLALVIPKYAALQEQIAAIEHQNEEMKTLLEDTVLEGGQHAEKQKQKLAEIRCGSSSTSSSAEQRLRSTLEETALCYETACRNAARSVEEEFPYRKVVTRPGKYATMGPGHDGSRKPRFYSVDTSEISDMKKERANRRASVQIGFTAIAKAEKGKAFGKKT